MINPVSIGEKIANKREELGLSQKDLSTLLFVTPQAISKWEKGLSIPSVDALARLTKILVISIDELLLNGSTNNLSELFNQYTREYVVKIVLDKKVDIDIIDNFHLFSEGERLMILNKWFVENESCNLRECWHLLSIYERIYVFSRISDEEKSGLFLSYKEEIILKRGEKYEYKKGNSVFRR